MRSHWFKLIIVFLFAVCGVTSHAQTCVPTGGVQCSPNLDLWLPPFNYPQWNVPMNANFNILDTLSANTIRTNTTNPQTMTGPLTLPTLTVTSLGSSTNVICPNGTGGALTTSGCTVPTGFPIILGSTSIAGFSTTTAIDGLTVNGVLLNSTGSSSLFLNQAGNYTAPAGGGSVTEVDTGAGLTGGPITGAGTISIASAGVTNAMLANNSLIINSTLCTLGGICAPAVSNLTGGAVGSGPYQSAPNTTAFIASPTTSGHAFVYMWQPSGSPIAPTAVDLGTYFGTNVTGTTPIVATPTTLGVALSCPTCGTASGGTSTSVNGGSTLGTLNINATAPVADASYLALLPKISGADMIIEAPYATSSAFGVLECGTGTSCTGGVISTVADLSGMTSGQVAIAGSSSTITSSIALGNSGSDIPQLSSGLLNASVIPNNSANTTGTAANLSGTPALPNGTKATTQTLGDNTTKLATDAFVIANAGSLSGMTSGQVAIAGSANSITSSIALGNSGSDIPQLSAGLLAASVIPNNAANTTGNAAALAAGALGSLPYQSAPNTTAFIASPTTTGHVFVPSWQPTGSAIIPVSLDLGTFVGANVTASSPIVATPSTLGTQISCPTCGTAGGGTSVGVNGGGTLGSLNINAIAPVADTNFLALTPKIAGADMIIEAPFATSSAFGVLKCGTGTTCTSGVISTASLSFTNILAGTNPNALLVSGSLGVSGAGTITATSMPYSGLTGTVPTWNQNTTGTASNLSGTPALPNGTTATTQTSGDNTTKLATDAFVQANAVHTICGGTIALPTTTITSGSFSLATPATCTGLLTTDDIAMDFNGSPIGVNGYTPSAGGVLVTIYKWPSANTINVAIGNSTSSSITPGSMTVNYHVYR